MPLKILLPSARLFPLLFQQSMYLLDLIPKKTLFLLRKKYITNNVSLNLSVKDVADYVHLSPEYFTKLFKKEVGQNIKSYILQVKVEIAKDLLGNPNIPISMVALDLGYSNFSHFTQVFEKIGRDHTNRLP